MCSDLRLRAASFAVLALALAGCGKQGDPAPRPRAIPQAANDLTLRQRGGELLFEASYPKTTVAGLPIEGLASATLYEVVTPLPGDGKPPVLPAPQFATLAKPVSEWTGAALDAAVVGDKLRFALPLPAGAIDPAQRTARLYALRTTEQRGLASAFSNVAAIAPVAAPEPPRGLTITPQAGGIALSWNAVPAAVGYVVLRREATEREWSAPLASLPASALTFFDKGALYGTRYLYTVLSLASATPAIESEPRYAREVSFRDQFPPSTPTELRVLRAGGEIRLIWEASPEADVAGYRVERSLDGRDWAALGALATSNDASDAAPPAARGLRYRVVAIDGAGNESSPTEPIVLDQP
jgi:hypothetical protein